MNDYDDSLWVPFKTRLYINGKHVAWGEPGTGNPCEDISNRIKRALNELPEDEVLKGPVLHEVRITTKKAKEIDDGDET